MKSFVAEVRALWGALKSWYASKPVGTRRYLAGAYHAVKWSTLMGLDESIVHGQSLLDKHTWIAVGVTGYAALRLYLLQAPRDKWGKEE